MIREMNKSAKKAGWDSPIKLSRRALIEAEQWMTQIKNNKPRNIEAHKTQAMIATDASLGRWGATLQILGMDKQRISKPQKVKILTSNRREIIAVKTDNTTACYYLINGKAKVGLRRLINQILLYIEEQYQEVKFKHILGVNNTEADSLSRLKVSGDYSMDKQVLQQVLEEWEI
ncbi:MAG: hypothetical protein EZS28_005967 [Streblomastix strix]|uniref:Reverse transcriptase RNase H-like domain-containing protein n=1 Tax=Streblomastix strix TaxID=222440 RepID=A0A5J4WUC0_9EUKA|nr:MAG: hypothetical protein EZS28_005967 [Streblomastix strix]